MEGTHFICHKTPTYANTEKAKHGLHATLSLEWILFGLTGFEHLCENVIGPSDSAGFSSVRTLQYFNINQYSNRIVREIWNQLKRWLKNNRVVIPIETLLTLITTNDGVIPMTVMSKRAYVLKRSFLFQNKWYFDKWMWLYACAKFRVSHRIIDSPFPIALNICQNVFHTYIFCNRSMVWAMAKQIFN